MDKTKIIERCTRKLNLQKKTLGALLDELEIIEEAEAKTPGAYTLALQQVRTRRDRQMAALKSTENYIAAIKASKK